MPHFLPGLNVLSAHSKEQGQGNGKIDKEGENKTGKDGRKSNKGEHKRCRCGQATDQPP